jgi:hypothetical protein
MRCGVHVCVEMELLEIAAPGWLVSPDGAGETDDGRARTMGKRHLRKYWKCPAPGCTRVAAFDAVGNGVKAETRNCPTCGDVTDAPGVRVARGDYRCNGCLREYNRRCKERMRATRAAERLQHTLDKHPADTRLDEPIGELPQRLGATA